MFALRFVFSDKLIGSATRHLGTAIGGALVVSGLADDQTALAVGGAVTTLAAFGASVVKRFVL